MKRLTAKGIEGYLKSKYGACRHDAQAMLDACRIIAKEFKCKAIEIFFFMIEGRDIQDKHLLSCGFETASGRELRESFSINYDRYLNN